jgi:hypothetical protein
MSSSGEQQQQLQGDDDGNALNKTVSGGVGAAVGASATTASTTSSTVPATSFHSSTEREHKNSSTASSGVATQTSLTNSTSSSTGHGSQHHHTSSSGTSDGPAMKLPPTSTIIDTSKLSTADRTVLEYLRQKGMGNAVVELSRILHEKVDASTNETKEMEENRDNRMDIDAASTSPVNKDQQQGQNQTIRQRLEADEFASCVQRSILTKSTGGGYGYDRDSAWPLLAWGIPEIDPPTTEGESAAALGVEEARAYVSAFVSFQVWLLSLPDHDGRQIIVHPLARARKLLQDAREKDSTSSSEFTNNHGVDGFTAADLVQEMCRPVTGVDSFDDGMNTHGKSRINDADAAAGKHLVFTDLPPSAKSELLAVSFALLVHTYCELLDVGMETVAQALRDAFRSMYEPLYPEEFKDLLACATTDEITRMNTLNSHHMDAVTKTKHCLIRIANYTMKQDELKNAIRTGANSAQQLSQHHQDQLRQYERNIAILQQKYEELAKEASSVNSRLNHVPFLRRARAVRWQLSISTSSYAMLTCQLAAPDGSLLPMSTLLQTKCELHVERRDPLPFTPACILDDPFDGEFIKTSSTPASIRTLNQIPISWAAPLPLRPDELNSTGSTTRTKRKQRLVGDTDDADDGHLPFPKYNLDDEYDDEALLRRDKRRVEFNRSLLVNGFRRLEALERKRDFEGLTSNAQNLVSELSGSSPHEVSNVRLKCNPLSPSVLLSTLCAQTEARATQSSPNGKGRGLPTLRTSKRSSATDLAAIWEESGIGLCSARICPPDGRRVAVGCDDSAVRIWDISDPRSEPTQILLGHKNGFPVFDVDWNRDGRALLSAGGDGAVRLWDTAAVGPFGEMTIPKPTSKSGVKPNSSVAGSTQRQAPGIKESSMGVPGLRPEESPYASGAALAVYRGHAPTLPIWSVRFAPAGYYFVSAAADATARLWCTERHVPLRLFAGHVAANVNCVEWHPNCNYIVTGCDDRTGMPQIWQKNSQTQINTFCPTESLISCVSFLLTP